MKETEGQRIRRLATERGITPDSLQLRTGITPHRLAYILGGVMPLENDERVKIAEALGLYQEELKDGYAETLGRFLRKEKEYECFHELYPVVALQPQREAEDLDPEDERFLYLCDEALEAHLEEHPHVWDRDDPIPWW